MEKRKGRPPKYDYVSKEDRRLIYNEIKRQEYRASKGNNVRPYRKSSDEYTGSFWMIKCSGLRTKALKLDIPFDLTPEYLHSIWTDYCPVFNVKMEVGLGNNSPSVDRIVPELGYVKGNVAWISTRANSVKGSASLPELEAVVKYLKNFKNTS